MQTADAKQWWANHPVTFERAQRYLSSVHEPYRDWAIEAVLSIGDVESVLEVGCHNGPLLRRLEALAGVHAVGLDINEQAVAMARDAGLAVEIGEIPEALWQFEDHSLDVVLSSYCLSYIAPEDLAETIAEMVRCARLGVVIVEPMAGPGVSPGVREHAHYVEWRHDYFEALDAARLRVPSTPTILMTRTRKYSEDTDINGVVVAKVTWHN